ncbi:MAG: membrane protein insertase YidC [Muribaculaceae bacterium]|nr:membrane protein insertase YidC [Muribaculaceae bacterium]
MDRNTIIGMLLMGAVIFGFMWLNQPSPEELEARKKQQETELAQAAKTQANSEATNDAITTDSLSLNDIAQLKSVVQSYGKASGTPENTTFTLANGVLDVTLNSNEINGTVALADTTIDIKSVIYSKVAAPLYGKAVTTIKNAVANIGKYRDFASYLNGSDSTVTLQNDLLKVNISSKGGVIFQATLKEYKAYNADQVVIFDKENNSYSFVLNSTDTRFDTKDLYFTPIAINDSTVLMSLNLNNGAKFGIRYTLPKDSYLVKMEIVQENMNKIIPANIADMGFSWHQKMSRHEEGEMFEERNSTIYYKFAGGDVEYLTETSEDSEKLNEKVRWIAFKNQFFSSILIADKYFSTADLSSVPFEKGTTNAKGFLKDLNASSSIEYSSANPNPASFHFFFGPNYYPLLSSYDEKISPDEDLKLTNVIPLGWSLFRWINTGFIIPVFDFLGGWITNYGIIILVLTLFIKIILFPLTYKSMISQAKMRLLAPDIKEINEKYPGQENAMVRQQKTMALYSSAGASPFSGCLPMLLQMPILFAMFTFFPSCIELRGESFLWVKDLSAPDAIISWNAQIPFITNYFGNHISLFCMLMTVTNILYTRINMQNQASSNQMPGMKLMMYAMPLMFLVFFNNYAAGLSYYYFISLLITIIQTYVFRYFVDEEKVRAKMAENAKKPKKKGGFMARIEEAQRQQQAALRNQQKKGGKR